MRIVIDTNHPNATRTDAPPAPLHHAKLARRLKSRLDTQLEASFIRGKTWMRDEVMDLRRCSALRAEQIVDSLVAHGYVSFVRPKTMDRDPRVGTWTFDTRRGEVS